MRTILHIDMNSYFASVAQQMNPFLRGKAIGVGGKPGTRGIIAAASREAKLRGVKTAMNAYEALRVCPELQIVDGDIDATLDCTRRFLKIFRRYTEAVEVFSIDEAFLDVSSPIARSDRDRTEAISIARSIKRDLRAELGEYITCSIGIAPNKLLAKLASGLKKPNGLVVLYKDEIASSAQADSQRHAFLSLRHAFLSLRGNGVTEAISFQNLAKRTPTTALCGIGPRVGLRLQTLGINTIADLGRANVGQLIDEFGPVLGYKLHQMGQGEDNSPVSALEPDPKSFGNSYTLLKDSTDREELRQVLYALTVKITARMRSEGFAARTVSGLIRYHNFTHESGRARLAAPSNDPLLIFRTIWQTIKVHLGLIPVRLLGVHATDLVQGGEQLTLLDVYTPSISPSKRGRKAQRASSPLRGSARTTVQSGGEVRRGATLRATDAINARYGPHTIQPALILSTKLKRHVSGFKSGQI